MEHWAHVYLGQRLLERGVTFEQFLAGTPQMRERVAVERRSELAARRTTAQRIARRQVDLDAMARYVLSARELSAIRGALAFTGVVAGGRRIEKLRHHRH